MMSLVTYVCVSNLLHPVPELAEGLKPLAGGGQLQQGVAAHHQVILDSYDVLRNKKDHENNPSYPPI